MASRFLSVFSLFAVGLSAQALRHVDVPNQSLGSATFDPARGTVLYLSSTDLFELDGGAWRRLPIGGPGLQAGRLFAAPSQHRLLAFRTSPSGYETETWVCDMVHWSLLPQANAPVFAMGQIAHDTARDEVVSFGGFSPLLGTLGETWIFDGVAWSQRQPAHSPPPSRNGTMAYDTARQRTVLVTGGSSGASQTWEWDGTDWTQIAVLNPPSRYDGALTFDAARARMVLVGGATVGAALADCWEYDGASWLQRLSLPAAGRFRHTLVYDPTQARTLLIGGEDGAFELADAWGWDGTAWSPAPGFGLAPRATLGAAIAVESGGTSLLLYGGASIYRWPTYLGETWRWDGASWTQLTGSAPPLLPTPGLAPGVQDALMWSQGGLTHLLFGYVVEQQGYGVPVYYWPHGMSTWNGTVWSPTAATAMPTPRRYAAIAVDTQRGEAVMFGGNAPTAAGGFVDVDDTWVFDGSTWQQRSPAARPSAREGHAMAYDAQRGRVVLFGGVDATFTPLTDTWEWDGTTWLQVATQHQPPAGSLAYDAAQQRVVLFVNPWGSNPSPLPPSVARAWTYDGVDWSPLPIDTASAQLPGQAFGGFGNDLLVASGSRLQKFSRDNSQLEAIGAPCTSDAARLSADVWPDLGQAAFALRITHAPAAAFALLAGSTNQIAVPALGCTLRVDPTQIAVALPTDARGRAAAPLPVPNTVSLLGAELFFQAATASALAPAGLSLTAALRLRIGR